MPATTLITQNPVWAQSDWATSDSWNASDSLLGNPTVQQFHLTSPPSAVSPSLASNTHSSEFPNPPGVYLPPSGTANAQTKAPRSTISHHSTSSSASPDPSPKSSTHSPTTEPSNRIKKRTLNTLAARRYRQKRVDQMSSLESALRETEGERDELKLKVARLEAEVEVLRGLVGGVRK